MADSSGASRAPQLFGQRDPVFRPWPLPTKQPANIAEFVQRLKTQGVEFRDLSEEGLRRQIEEEKAKEDEEEGEDGNNNNSNKKKQGEAAADAKNGADRDASNDKPKGIEAMIAKRDEVLMSLESALQSGLISVDFVSLLLSKDRPTQAMQTLSTFVRDKVGIGTLSAGRIANAAQAARALQSRGGGGAGGGGGGMSAAELQTLDETTRSNAQRLVEHKAECVGWQLLAMDRATEVLDVGRKRLRAEMRREETYWSEVLAVRDRGWGLSRMPGQRRVLRVKFGFSEAAPDLRALGFAPLRRVKRGHVALDLTALGPPSAIIVTLRKQGQGQGGNTSKGEMGRSPLAVRLPASAPLEDRILEARNTMNAKELWRELNREARLMVSHGVAFRNSEIVFPAGAQTEGVISLEPLHLTSSSSPSVDDTKSELEPTRHEPNHSPELNNLAEVTCTALHLFLAHGHRDRYRQRSVPSPPSDAVPSPPTYFMLRPVVANIKYEKAVKHISAYLSDLCAILHGVGQTGSRFTLFERPLSSYIPPATAMARSGQQQSSSEGLCTAFLAPREFSFELYINPLARILIRCRTTVVPLKAQYLIQLLPPSSPPNPPAPSAAPSPPAKNPLLDVFPPADNYGTLRDVLEYLGGATAHILAAQARQLARDWEDRSGTGAAWSTSVDGMEVRQLNNAFWKLRFSVVPQSAVTELDALVELEEGEEQGPGTNSDNAAALISIDDDEDDYVDETAAANNSNADGDGDGDGDQDKANACNVDSPLARPSPPELRVYASWPVAQSESAVYRKWVWSAESLGRGQATKGGSLDLEAVVEGCISARLKPQVGSSQA